MEKVMNKEIIEPSPTVFVFEEKKSEEHASMPREVLK